MYQDVASETTKNIPPTRRNAVITLNRVSKKLANGATIRDAIPQVPTAIPEANPFLSGNQLTAVTTPGL